MVWFPEGVWGIVKGYAGVYKYYLVPSRKKSIVNQDFAQSLSNKCFNRVISILQIDEGDHHPPLATYLFRTCIFMIRYNDWIQAARSVSEIWDRFSLLLASRCHRCLQHLNCLGADTATRCAECTPCLLHYSLENASRTFYTVYLGDGRMNLSNPR